MRTPSIAALCLAALLLAGCKTELYSNLKEREANEIVSVLLRSGIPASRTVAKDKSLTVHVEEDRFAEAVEILKASGLPRQNFATMGDVFQGEGLISSPVEERARMIYALSQELSRTISDIDGVLSARIHVVLPENDPLRQNLTPSSASVFVRHDKGMDLAALVPQIKMLVANSIAGLTYEKVSVVLFPSEAQPVVALPPPATTIAGVHLGDSRSVLIGGGALAAAAVAGAAYLALRRRDKLNRLPAP